LSSTDPSTSAPSVDSTESDSGLARRVGTVAVIAGVVSAWLMGRQFGVMGGVSSAIGTVVGLLNLWVLARLVTRLLDPKVDAGKGTAMVLLLAKTAALFVGVGLLLRQSWVHGGSFMAGITAVVVAIAGGGLWDAVSPKPESVSDSDEGKR